jgi:hypothetical protein
MLSSATTVSVKRQDDSGIEKNLEGSNRGLIDELSGFCLEGLSENHEKSQLG